MSLFLISSCEEIPQKSIDRTVADPWGLPIDQISHGGDRYVCNEYLNSGGCYPSDYIPAGSYEVICPDKPDEHPYDGPLCTVSGYLTCAMNGYECSVEHHIDDKWVEWGCYCDGYVGECGDGEVDPDNPVDCEPPGQDNDDDCYQEVQEMCDSDGKLLGRDEYGQCGSQCICQYDNFDIEYGCNVAQCPADCDATGFGEFTDCSDYLGADWEGDLICDLDTCGIDDSACVYEGTSCTPGTTQNCPLQLGVCSGSTETCNAQGEWPGCTASDYGSDYEVTEITCDGVADNDCDGDIDGVDCDCLVGYTNCDGECVNIMEDEDHCGECFNPCDPYYECMGGWCELVCVDSDGDTFNVNEEECGPMDCDDSDSSIYPGAEEICDDGIDQDCDGEDCYEGIEYCNNCVDDEGDGLVDCEDPECFDDPFCINLEYSGKGAVTRYSYSKGALAYSKFDDINECNDVDESKFYYQDRMGNNRVTINQEGEVSNFKSLPYGQVIQGGIKKGFVNKQMENGSGLYYFGARFYDPDLGRFTSVDPVAENEPYSYVANNPMMYTDPTGMYLNLDLLWVEKMASGDFASAEQESVGAAGVSDEEAEMKAWEKFYEENIYYEGIEQDDIYRGPYEPLQGEPNPFGIMGIRDAGLLDPIPWLAGVAAVNLLKAGAGALAGSARQKIFITYKTPVEGVGGAGASVPAGFKTVFVNSADEVLSVIKNNPGAIFAYEMHGTPFALYKFASGGPLARSALVNAFAKARAAAVIDGSCWGSYALPLYENAGISAIASYQNTIPGVGRVITTSHGTVSIGSVAHLARAYPRLSSLNSGIYSYGRHTAMTRLHPNTATFDLAGFARYVGN